MHRFTLLLFLLPLTGLAAPPPGHPTALEGNAIMGLPQDGLSHRGKVISAMDANQYTYIELDMAGGPIWLAAPLMSVKAGDWVRFGDGAVMNNWYSKLLKRTFQSILFVSRAVVEQ